MPEREHSRTKPNQAAKPNPNPEPNLHQNLTQINNKPCTSTQMHNVLWVDVETMGIHCYLVFTGESSFQGFFGGAGFRPSTGANTQTDEDTNIQQFVEAYRHRYAGIQANNHPSKQHTSKRAKERASEQATEARQRMPRILSSSRIFMYASRFFAANLSKYRRRRHTRLVSFMRHLKLATHDMIMEPKGPSPNSRFTQFQQYCSPERRGLKFVTLRKELFPVKALVVASELPHVEHHVPDSLREDGDLDLQTSLVAIFGPRLDGILLGKVKDVLLGGVQFIGNLALAGVLPGAGPKPVQNNCAGRQAWVASSDKIAQQSCSAC